MPFVSIEPDDERLEPYRHLRTRNLTRFSHKFIAESRLLVQRLLASEYAVESILMDEDYVRSAPDWIPAEVTTYLLSHQQIESLVGFHFHRGFLACGIRRPTEAWREVLAAGMKNPQWTGMLAESIHDPENLGVILRTCAALGIRDCFLNSTTADPLSRRVLRVSMGTALKLNLVPVDSIPELIRAFQSHQGTAVAASLQEPATRLADFHRTGPTLVMLGNEAYGLSSELQREANCRLKIDMDLGVDSLNVSVAAGIILHFVTRLANAG